MSTARRQGGLRAAEKRREARERFLLEVEAVDPSLLPLARKLERRTVPYRPAGQSRLEWFLRYVQEHPHAQWEALDTPESYEWPEPEIVYPPGSVVLTLCDTEFSPCEGAHSPRDLSLGRLQWLPAIVVDGVPRGGMLTLADAGARFDVPLTHIRGAA